MYLLQFLLAGIYKFSKEIKYTGTCVKVNLKTVKYKQNALNPLKKDKKN